MRDNEKKKVHDNLKQEIRSLLISSPKTKYGGLTGSLLYFDYKQLNCGKEVPYAELGFHSFLALLRSMPDVVRIEYKENSSSYRVHPVYNESTAHIQKMVYEQRDKYQHQNEVNKIKIMTDAKLYNQNWYSNQQFPFFQNYSSYRALNNVETNFPTSHRQTFSQNFSVPNKRKIESNFEPYLFLTPLSPTDNNNKQDENNVNLLSCLSSNHENCSTPKTFIETPTNFDVEDYYLNESIQLSEKDIPEDNNINSSFNNQIEQIPDDPLLTTSINLKNEIIFEVSTCTEHEQSKIDENKILIKRLNDAIHQCINFRYIHRLCEIKFEYRHYSLSNEILLIKSKLEEKAFNQYQQELKDFQLNSIIDDQICQIMFNQYISLQRNYYYMIKLMNKKQR